MLLFSGICRWNSITVCNSFRATSNSGFGGHDIAISVCPSMLHLFVNTFLKFAVVENFASAARITIILISEAFGCVSQRASKFAGFRIFCWRKPELGAFLPLSAPRGLKHLKESAWRIASMGNTGASTFVRCNFSFHE